MWPVVAAKPRGKQRLPCSWQVGALSKVEGGCGPPRWRLQPKCEQREVWHHGSPASSWRETPPASPDWLPLVPTLGAPHSSFPLPRSAEPARGPRRAGERMFWHQPDLPDHIQGGALPHASAVGGVGFRGATRPPVGGGVGRRERASWEGQWGGQGQGSAARLGKGLQTAFPRKV